VTTPRDARLAALLALASLLACPAPPPAPPDLTTPGGTVERFFDLLETGSQPEVLALCTDQARRALEDPTVFRSWVEQITRHGTIERVRIVDVSVDEKTGDGATVDFEVRYGGGAADRRTVALQREGEGWRLGVIL